MTIDEFSVMFLVLCIIFVFLLLACFRIHLSEELRRAELRRHDVNEAVDDTITIVYQ
jgi:hypothetical protein